MSEPKTLIRCPWAGDNELYIKYHDEEWGTPLHDERALFEMLCLEGAQAGLSWLTILSRRQNYRRAFDNFQISKIAKYNQAKIDELLMNTGIIRNRLKINSVVANAKATLMLQQEFGSLGNYFWQFVGSKPVQHKFTKSSDVPASDEISEKLSRDLKKWGFSFVGPTIMYAHMQATGMVNDHLTSCFRYKGLVT